MVSSGKGLCYLIETDYGSSNILKGRVGKASPFLKILTNWKQIQVAKWELGHRITSDADEDGLLHTVGHPPLKCNLTSALRQRVGDSRSYLQWVRGVRGEGGPMQVRKKPTLLSQVVGGEGQGRVGNQFYFKGLVGYMDWLDFRFSRRRKYVVVRNRGVHSGLEPSGEEQGSLLFGGNLGGRCCLSNSYITYSTDFRKDNCLGERGSIMLLKLTRCGNLKNSALIFRLGSNFVFIKNIQKIRNINNKIKQL